MKNKINNKQTFSLHNSKYPLFINDYNNNNENEKNTELFTFFINKNKKNKKGKRYSCSQLVNNKILKEYRKNNLLKRVKSNSVSEIKKYEFEKSFFEIKDRNNNIIPKPIEKQNFSWCSYILYVMLFKKKNSKIIFFENFRAHILSEENFWQNHLDIYKLLDFCNIKKTIPLEKEVINT